MTGFRDHAFSLTREYAAAPPRVFDAWADPQAKGRWFAASGPGRGAVFDWRMEFRPGGREEGRIETPFGPVTYHGVYHLTERPQRILHTYEMRMDGRLFSASLTSIDFAEHAGGCRMTYAERLVHVDAPETLDMRRTPCAEMLDRLGDLLVTA